MLLSMLPSLQLHFLVICTGIEKCMDFWVLISYTGSLMNFLGFEDFCLCLQVGVSLSMFLLSGSLEALLIWGCSVLVYSLMSGNTSLLFCKMFTLLPFYFCLFLVTSNPDTSILTFKIHVLLNFLRLVPLLSLLCWSIFSISSSDLWIHFSVVTIWLFNHLLWILFETVCVHNEYFYLVPF